MGRDRKQKFIIMISLMVAIASMSLGFAAFSTTLNISSGATVSPDSSNFKVVFSGSDTKIDDYENFLVTGVGDGVGINLDEYYITEDTFDVPTTMFFTNNKHLEFTIYAHNIGEYDAYLNSVNISNVTGWNTWKVCEASTTDDTKATYSLVQAACEGIDLTVKIDGVEYAVNEGNLSGVLLEKGEVVPVSIIVSYKVGSQLSDGPFDVSFGNISLEYGTVDSNMITFTVNGVRYYAEPNMTWEIWMNSSYAPEGYYLDGDYVCNEKGLNLKAKFDSLIASHDYVTNGACKN